MHLILLCVGVVFVLVFLFGCLEEDFLGGLLSGTFFAFVALIVSFFIAGILGEIFATGERVEREHTELVNLVDNTETQGRFFLGSGSIDGVPTYSWYEETAPNSFERRDVDASLSTVHYTTGDEPPYYVYSVEKHEKFFHNWYIDLSAGIDSGEHWDFYIPRGSITNEYKLDAK